MNKEFSKFISLKLIADNTIHSINIGDEVLFYKLSFNPIITFSFSLLKDKKVIHWYQTKTFKTSKEWISFCRAIIRKNLASKQLLTNRKGQVRLLKKVKLVKELTRRKYV
ncbi:hypothetical protein AADZ86_15625 [Colwelliaceae bacterium BS250]